MNINCPICSEMFLPTDDDIFITPCGHVFHHNCLLKWIERSTSCPQCRNKTTEKNIHRIYFNFPNTENITQDAETLQLQLDSTKFQLQEIEKDLVKCKEEKEQLQENFITTEQKILILQENNSNKNSTIEMLKQRIDYMKSEVNEASRLYKEVEQLRSKVTTLQYLQDIIDSEPANVESIVKNVSDTQTLNTYIVFLKRALTQTESKKKKLQESVKNLQKDLQQYKISNSECLTEIRLLKTRIQDVETINETSQKNLENDIEQQLNETIVVPKILKRKSDDAFIGSEPSPLCLKIQKKVKNSPYLCLKQNPTTFPIKLKQTENKTASNLYILTKKNSFGRLEDSTSLNILKNTSVKQKQLETSYNGLGGHSKCDTFPTASTSGSSSSATYKLPKKNKGLKRPEGQTKIDKFCSP